LSNTNENATVRKILTSHNLNKAKKVKDITIAVMHVSSPAQQLLGLELRA
jgi:hypothetical protein